MCFELAFERNLRIQTILGDPAAESAGDGGGGGGGGVETGTFYEESCSMSNFSCPIRRFPRPNYPPLGLWHVFRLTLYSHRIIVNSPQRLAVFYFLFLKNLYILALNDK